MSLISNRALPGQQSPIAADVCGGNHPLGPRRRINGFARGAGDALNHPRTPFIS